MKCLSAANDMGEIVLPGPLEARGRAWMRQLKPLFPLQRFAEDVTQHGGAKAVAKRAGVAPSQVYGWLRPDGPAPRHTQLERVLVANAIDRGPYLAYLAEASPTVSVWCPDCKKSRDVERGDLYYATAATRVALPPPCLLPDGRVEWLCKGCAHARLKQRGLMKTDLTDFNTTLLSAFVREDEQWVCMTDRDDSTLAAAQRQYPDPKERGAVKRKIRRRAWVTALNTPDAKQKAKDLQELDADGKARALERLETEAAARAKEKYDKIGQKASAAKSDETKAKMSHSAFRLRGRLHGRFYLCPLDGLFLYKPKKYGRATDVRWHKQCHMRWMICRREWGRSHPGLVAPQLPPPIGKREGRPAGARNGARLMQDFEMMLDYYDPEANATLAELANKNKMTKSGALKTIDRVLARQGGRWNVTFSTGGYVTGRAHPRSHARSFSGTNERKNRELQKLVPLPDALESHVASGARDRLVARLHFFRMPVRDIVELTGVPDARVQALLESPLALEVGAEIRSWLERKAVPTRDPGHDGLSADRRRRAT